MESKHENKPSGLRVHTDSRASVVDNSTGKKKFRDSHSRSASSSPDSPLDDPFSECEINEDPQSDVKHGESIKVTKQVPTTSSKPPPVQAMERPLGTAYKIPSRVFARTKSTAPVEWSVASNESLFSIHVGDSSFGTDSMFNYNLSYEQSSRKITILPDKASEIEGGEGAVETATADENLTLTPSVSCQSNLSDLSAGSVHSFAFPILTGHNGKYGSTRIDESVRMGFDYSSQRPTPTTPQKQPSPQPQQKPEQSNASPSTSSSWFGWSTCCTACSK